jgi:hypothetical protein
MVTSVTTDEAGSAPAGIVGSGARRLVRPHLCFIIDPYPLCNRGYTSIGGVDEVDTEEGWRTGRRTGNGCEVAFPVKETAVEG